MTDTCQFCDNPTRGENKTRKRDNRKKLPREQPLTYVEALLRRQMGLPMELQHIAMLMGVHKSTVQQIEARALAKIRAVIEKERLFR